MRPIILAGVLFLAATASAQLQVEVIEAAPAGPTARPFGRARVRTLLDTRFHSAPGDDYSENVAELIGDLALGGDIKVSDAVRANIEGRLRYQASTEAGFGHAQARAQPMVGETFVDLYGKWVDLRVGYQVVAFGQNPLAPSDALNPRDLTQSMLSSDLETLKLPSFALRARGTAAVIDWEVAYFPFFTPHEYEVFGSDTALLQPGSGIPSPPQLDPSIEDLVQPRLLETQRPRHFPQHGDIGVRAVASVVGLKLGASYVFMFEKLPRVELDPELALVLSQLAQGEEPGLGSLLSVRNRIEAGEQLYRGTYPRQHLFGLELSRLLGPVQVDADVSYSPAQTFYDARFAPLRPSTVTAVLGLSQAEDSDFTYALSYLGLAVLDVPAGRRLFLLEPEGVGASVRTPWLHLVSAQLGYALFNDKLKLEVRALVDLSQGSFALAPRVAYELGEGVVAAVAAELFQGRAQTPFGYFGRNDQVALGVSWSFF